MIVIQRAGLRHLTAVAAAILLGAAGVAAMPLPSAAAATTITVNGAGTGRTFDGIGAISGGGGNSRLLSDYPATQQQQILDYLFEPGYGADLQILKVEIGGDTNSTDGSESSIEHTSGSINCNAGYEWSLMQQAKALNPSIKLYALSWGAPGWIGTFFSQAMINYLVSWLNCARSHGLTIDYLGGWNEKGFNESWYESLHSTLAADGFSTKVVGADDSGSWAVADSMQATPAFAAAVDIVGVHYPCGYLSTETSCPSTANAIATGKQLWASENGSQDYNGGAAAMARGDNRDYIDGKMTATINWPILAAISPNLPFATDGLILANQPWSGAYTVGKQAWVTAQTTQFTSPGWTYIDSASGYLGGNRANGSYVTLKSPSGGNWSSIIETMDATAAQTVTYNVTGGLSTAAVHVWSTNVSSSSSANWFVHSSDITPSGGSFSLTLQPGFVYSLTTTTGQGKGTAASPASASLALPYSDNFDSDTAGQQPRYLEQQQGAFEVGSCAAGRSGQCLDQVTPARPIEWTPDSNPYTIGGDPGWANYTVGTDALIAQAGSVQVIARAGTQHSFGPAGINEYYLQLSNTGAWSIVRNNTSDALATLASGTVAAPGTGTWHHLALTVSGSTLTAVIDGVTVGTATDGTYSSGLAGLGTSGYQTDQFDNFSVTAASGGGGSATGPIVAGVNTAKCVDDNGNSATPGTKVAISDCTGGASQNWTIPGDGTIRINGGCLDITGAGTANGTLAELWTCNGGANQQWQAASGTLVNPVSGKCLDDPGRVTTNGTQLEIWTCNGGSNQQWRIP